MKIHMSYVPKFIFLILILLSGCLPLEPQNPADIFADKKFPHQLEILRSQIREFTDSMKEHIVARTQTDRGRTDLLRVAVIDSGFDVANRDLFTQMEYRVQDGRIVGAGLDILGAGAFASHVYVNATLFAFSARSIRGGRIVGDGSSPLALLKDINQRFSQIVLQRIQADPVLRDSLFSRLGPQAFTFLGFENLINNKSAYLESYNQTKSRGRLVNASTPIPPEPNLKEVVLGIQNFWTLMTDTHVPKALSDLSYVEHADVFTELVVKAYATIEREFDLSRRRKNINSYIKVQDGESPRQDEFPPVVRKAMEYIVYGIDAFDPIAQLERAFVSHPDYNGLTFAEAVRKHFASQREILQQYLASPLIDSEIKRKIEKHKNELVKLETIIKNFMTIKADSVAYQSLRSAIRRNVIRTRHPYLSENSNDNKHGTHVAAIIAAQNPNIRIFPIRVTTTTVSIAESRKREIHDQLLNAFDEFTQSPYFEPLKKAVSAEYNNLQISNDQIRNRVQHYLKENSLNAVFIIDLLKAVEAVGASKIKLANVSLGTVFQKGISRERAKESLAEDIFAEFIRWKIGKAIQEKAPGTLFLVATGNDKSWIDGVSRTAFPVGITSQRLMQIAQEQNLAPAPNNAQTNILAIASVNANGNLTPFTNLFIHPNIPVIYSTGQEVMSSIPPKSSDIAIEEAKKKLAPITNYLELLKRAAKVFFGNGLDPNYSTEKKEVSALTARISAELNQLVGEMANLHAPVGRQSLSGPSMSTPSALGVLADFVLNKIQLFNKSGEDLYLDPDFMPDVLIKDIFSLSESKELNSQMTISTLVKGIKTWKAEKNTARRKRMLNALVRPQLNPSASCASVVDRDSK